MHDPPVAVHTQQLLETLSLCSIYTNTQLPCTPSPPVLPPLEDWFHSQSTYQTFRWYSSTIHRLRSENKKKTPAHVYVCVCVLCINNGNSSSKCDYLICVTIRMKGGGVCEWEREREREREEGKGWGRERKKENTPEVPLYYSATCQPVQRVYSMTGIAALFLINAHHLRHHSEY